MNGWNLLFLKICPISFSFCSIGVVRDAFESLLSSFSNVPQNLFSAVVETNKTRKDFLINYIKSLKVKSVGIYRLQMKKDSDNFRESSIYDILRGLSSHKIKTLLLLKLKNIRAIKLKKI